MHNLKWLKPVNDKPAVKQPSDGQKHIVVQQTKMEHFSGAIPHPEHLAQYESVMPGLSERLVRMVESEGEHRRLQEVKAVDASIEDMRTRADSVARGQWFSLWIALGGLGVAALIGHASPAAGATLGGGIVTALAAAFIIGSKRSSKNEEQS